MPGVYLVWLESLQIASAARPGQFVMVHCGEDTVLRRPISVHQVDKAKNRLALLFKVVGKGTLWLSQRRPCERIDLFGPLGNGFSIDENSNHLLLIAGGIGIAPLRFLAQEAAGKGYPVKLLQGAQTASHLYPGRFIPSEIEFITATEDGTAGKKGIITDLLSGLAGWADQIFACGPMPMYQTMAQIPELKGKPQISLEMRMGCGLGICYGCTVKTKGGLRQVCKDGPVFCLDDIIQDQATRL